mmetsp:Transcript_11861/g.19232  ORF Transcript_11861/g.19232 Transcript_11861/m.19232 type:complete len:159 (-) Transcript_11861:117-593(-)
MTENERFTLEMFVDKPTIEYTSDDSDDVIHDNLSAVVNAQMDGEFGDDHDEDLYKAEVLDMAMMISTEQPYEGDDAATPSDASASPPEKLSTIQAQEKALKKMGNISRYTMNMECTKDISEVGRTALEDVVEEREKELAAEEKRLSIIYDAVSFYKKK